jgi:hypothetical protein
LQVACRWTTATWPTLPMRQLAGWTGFLWPLGFVRRRINPGQPKADEAQASALPNPRSILLPGRPWPDPGWTALSDGIAGAFHRSQRTAHTPNVPSFSPVDEEYIADPIRSNASALCQTRVDDGTPGTRPEVLVRRGVRGFEGSFCLSPAPPAMKEGGLKGGGRGAGSA